MASQKCAVLAVSYNHNGFPWIDLLKENNPDIDLFTILDDRIGQKRYLWRSCDVMLRNWWINNNHLVYSTHLWFLEHDVMVNDKLPDHKSISGMGGKDIKHIRASKWQWFAESALLEDGMKPIGVAPFGITLYSRQALDAIAHSKWNNLYAKDIFCELRTPSIIYNSGLGLDSIPLPFVDYKAVSVSSKKGIFHSVKKF